MCTGQLVEELMGHSSPVTGIAFTPDGMGLVTGSYGGSVKYWDISSFRMQASIGKEVWNLEHDVRCCLPLSICINPLSF